MEITPQILAAKVMHRRLFPKINAFTYRLYYLAVPLPAFPLPSIVQRFPAADLGYRDGRCPHMWAQEALQSYGLADKTTHMMLITMPRVFGYVFNPVSFYLCFDSHKQLRAVISEVHNTFGEQHSYLCAHADHRPINPEEWLEAEKLFHVSPFLERKGSYRFRFDIQKEKLGIWIDYYDQNNHKQLITSFIGNLSPLNRRTLAWAFWRYPIVPLRAIALIHWQALKLLVKGIRHIPKPEALADKWTASSDLTKM